MENILIMDLIQQLKDVENADLWIDENFKKKLLKVNDETAFERPISNLHSVAELISHLTEWRKEVLSRLQGNPRGLEMSDAANWRSNEELKEMGWENLLNGFYNSQQQLISFLAEKDDSYLYSPYPYADASFPHNYQYLATGLIHHDFYHLGQIGITIKFLTNGTT
jgi:uncharacterized damage-inducible protein DinB